MPGPHYPAGWLWAFVLVTLLLPSRLSLHKAAEKMAMLGEWTLPKPKRRKEDSISMKKWALIWPCLLLFPSLFFCWMKCQLEASLRSSAQQLRFVALCGIGNKHLPEPWALHWFCNLASLMYKACSCGVGRQAAVRTLPQQPSSDRMIQRELFIWGACYSTVGWWKLISTVPMHFEGQTLWYCWCDAIFPLSRMTLLHQDIIGLSVSSVCLLS